MDRKLLIVDAGGTSTDYALLRQSDGGFAVCVRGKGRGLNVALLSPDDATSRVNEIFDVPALSEVDGVYFYGAGCAGDIQKKKVTDAFRKLESFRSSKIEVNSDLLGAGRGVFGKDSGVVCILGTGSATGYYSEGEIKDTVPSLGYILGDEGSGAAIGREIVNCVYKKLWSDDLRREFLDKYNLSVSDVIERVYRSESPNAFLASLVGFAWENSSRPEIEKLLKDVFRKLVSRNLLYYKKGTDPLQVCFSGGVANAFSGILRKVCEEYSLECGCIAASPLDGLIEYHTMI